MFDEFQIDLTHWNLKKNGRRFADNIFKCISFDENLCILIQQVFFLGVKMMNNQH